MNKDFRVGFRILKSFRTFPSVVLFLVVACFARADAQTLTPLHQFSSINGLDGGDPLYVHLIQATDGNFYGTTIYGGTNSAGTVFKITPTGTINFLYYFKGSAANDGEFPEAGVVQGSDGNFYGTTYEGGSNSYGTVFKMTPTGVLTNLHIFVHDYTNGLWPFSQMIEGTDGFFYGTTSAGGTRGYGTVFKIDSNGNFSTIYSFTNGLDGSDPYAGVYQGSDGNFYGTTEYGGGTNCPGNGCGTVYKVTSAGTLTSLHQFGASPQDGRYPIGGIIQGWDGNYYGTTYDGGTNSEGTVFRVTSAGTLTNLYQFGALTYDGLDPNAALLQGSDGYLYGTTYEGGSNAAGTLFRIGLTGGLVYIHDFGAVTVPIGDGVEPASSPVEGYDGNLYGTTFHGGTNELGIIYKFSFPVPPNPNQPTGFTQTGNPNGNPNGTSTVVFGVAAIAGETYQLQFANTLSPSTIWSNVPGVSVTNATGGPLSFTNFITGVVSQQFYRFQITP